MASLTDILTQSQDKFQQLGWPGIFVYAGGIVVLQMVLSPVSPVAVAAGLIFGFRGGIAAVTLGTSVGAAVNFLVARYVARNAIARRFSHHEKFRLIDAAVGCEGGKIIALLRLCPIPFGIANYCFGLTAVRFWPYLIATFIATIPANSFFVWLGVSAHRGLAVVAGTQQPRHPGEYVLIGVGLIAGFLALRTITRVARNAIEKGDSTAT